MSISAAAQRKLFLASFVFLIGLISFLFIIPFLKERNFYRFLNRIQRSQDFVASELVVAARYEGDDDLVADFNSLKRIHPGSNFKLFTAAAALKYLKPDFRFSTKLFKSGDDLIFVGGGDPSLQHKDFAEFVEAVKKSGKIRGNIYYDDSYFEGERYGPSWGHDWFDQYFAVPITGLQINNNLLEIRGLENERTKKFEITTRPLENYQPIIDRFIYFDDPEKLKREVSATLDENGNVVLRGDSMPHLPFSTSATIKDPSRFAAQVLKQELLKAGLISPAAQVLPFTGKNQGQLLWTHPSAPLKDLVYQMLKFSKNNYAETLVRTLGREIHDVGSQAEGVDILNEFFEEIGIPEAEISAVDGSGLSPLTRVSADAILRLFIYINQQDWKDIFWNALPESQVDGTLKNRFENAGLKHTVIAKTGTHEFSSSLSGKILREDEGRKNILFSIHVYSHQFSTEESVARVIPVIDKIVALLDKQF